MSVAFLAAGAALAALQWGENRAPSERADRSGPTIADAWGVMARDRRIQLVGAVQALFEGAMYIFVLQWPPSLIRVAAGPAPVPFGKVRGPGVARPCALRGPGCARVA